MNYTKSGIIACGAPHSRARTAAELENALDKSLTLLLLTDEGLAACERFALAEGCKWETMPDESRAEILNWPHAWKFFAGALWGLEQ